MVTELVSQDGRTRGVGALEGEVPADRVVITTGSWSGQIRGCDPTVPVVPQRGQILALGRAANVPMRRVVVPYGDPYLVPRPDGRVIVGATPSTRRLRRNAHRERCRVAAHLAMDLVPDLAESPIVELWDHRPLSPDGLPIVGPGFLEGLFFLTGHGPSGIAPAPASVKLLVALMLGEPRPCRPSRSTRGASRAPAQAQHCQQREPANGGVESAAR